MLMVFFHLNSPRKVVSVGIVLFHFFNFVLEMVLEIALSSCKDGSTDVCSDGNRPDSKYAGRIVLLSGDSTKFQVFLNRPNNIIGVFWVFSTFEV